MSDKYIIRNCPCFFEENEEVNDYTCSWCGTEELACQDCTDCVLKRILQVCNEYSDKWEDCDFSNGLSDEIFKLLDIEEVK